VRCSRANSSSTAVLVTCMVVAAVLVTCMVVTAMLVTITSDVHEGSRAKQLLPQIDAVNLEDLDLDDRITRFRTLAAQQYKAETIGVYNAVSDSLSRHTTTT
jgi:hypothetical protein